MASHAIRASWFGWVAKTQGTVGPSGVGPPQTSEAQWLANLAPVFTAGTRTTQAAGAVTAGNVVSSNPAAGTKQNVGTAIAYLVSV